MLLYQLSALTITALGLEEDERGTRFVPQDEHPNAAHVVKGIAVIRPIGSIFFGALVRGGEWYTQRARALAFDLISINIHICRQRHRPPRAHPPAHDHGGGVVGDER